MNKEFDKEMEYQKGLDELYNETAEFGRIDFVKVIFDIKKELDIANKKIDKIKEYCKEDAEYWGNDSYINGLYEGYKDAINGVLSIIGGE